MEILDSLKYALQEQQQKQNKKPAHVANKQG